MLRVESSCYFYRTTFIQAGRFGITESVVRLVEMEPWSESERAALVPALTVQATQRNWFPALVVNASDNVWLLSIYMCMKIK